MDADYTGWSSAVAAFSAIVCWTNHLFIVIMAKAYRNADLSLAIFRPLLSGRRFTAKIGNLFLVLHKCNIWIYFLLLLTQVDFFGTTFYFLESRKFSHYFYFLKSRIFGMYFYFLESSKGIYFWQHWLQPGGHVHKEAVHLLYRQPTSITISNAFKPECNSLSQFREDTGGPSMPVREFNLIACPLALDQSSWKTPFQAWIWTQAGESHQPVRPADTGLFSSLDHWAIEDRRAFHRSRHWSVASPAWVGRPAARRTNWTFDVKTAACELL